MIVSAALALASMFSPALIPNRVRTVFVSGPSFTVSHLPYLPPNPISNKNKDEMNVGGCGAPYPASWTVDIFEGTTLTLLNNDPISGQVWSNTGNPSEPRIIHVPTVLPNQLASTFLYRYKFHWTRSVNGDFTEGTITSPLEPDFYVTSH